jgi:hypothetical protein
LHEGLLFGDADLQAVVTQQRGEARDAFQGTGGDASDAFRGTR